MRRTGPQKQIRQHRLVLIGNVDPPTAKRVLCFGIFTTTILVCDALYWAVLCSWFAIWFANSLRQPMSAYLAIADVHDVRSHVCF